MKKLFALLLAVVMIMSLAACGGDKTPSKPDNGDKPGASTPATNPDESTPDTSNPNETTPGESDGAWVIKTDLSAPAFVAPQKVTDEVHFETGDAFFTMNLYKSSWSDMDPAALMAELKAMPFFEGWSWNLEREERGYGKLYSDVGQQRNFEYTVTVTAEKEENGTSSRVTIYFSADSNTYVGWRRIATSYGVYGDEKMDAAHQEAILPVMEKIYGTGAEYMLYAPITDERNNTMEHKTENELGSETVSRSVDEYSVDCAIYASSKLENSFEQYAGDYVPMLDSNEPEYYRDVFGDFGSLNFNEIKKVGSEFFKENFDGYAYTTPGTYEKMYTYAVTEYENGDKDVEFSLDMLVYQKDASYIEGMEFQLEYTVEVRDGAMNVKRAEIHMPALCEYWDDNDPENATVIKRLNENLTYAKKVANAVFGTNFEFTEVHWNGGSDYKLWDSYETEMFGRKVNIRFDFNTKTMDSISKNRTSFTISIY